MKPARKTPEWCDCNNSGEPSPWHCACGWWKPAAAERCETCVLAELEERWKSAAA